MGLLGRPLTDEACFICLQKPGLETHFKVGILAGADHPNTVDIELFSIGALHRQWILSDLRSGLQDGLRTLYPPVLGPGQDDHA